MRPALGGSPVDTAMAALAGLRARIALLDQHAVVVWTNSSWSRFRQGQAVDALAAVALGVNYLSVCRRSPEPAAGAIAEGVRAVVEQAATFFELEYANGPQGRRTKISVTPAPAGQDGAVVMQVDSYGATATLNSLAAAEPVVSTAVFREVLTGRERDVLMLMARGLENQAIATELAIGYSTVRAHVRSLMAKLGARSRLGAVVRAVQLDLVSVPESRGE